MIGLALALPLSACSKPRATYFAGPPSTLAGEPLVEPADATCVQAVAGWFKRADANGDGVLSLTEARADGQRFFAVVDADGDGIMTPGEITDYRVRIYPREYLGGLATPQPPTTPAVTLPGGDELPDPARRQFMRTPATADPIMAADQNLDFRVTGDEILAKLTERGSRLDVNQDGQLSRDEVLVSCASK